MAPGAAAAARAGAPPLRPRLPPPAPPAPVSSAGRRSEKVTFAADAFFDFDKSVLKPEGKAKLDDLVTRSRT